MNVMQYPIGQFAHDGVITTNDIARWNDDIAALLGALHSRSAIALRSLTPEQLQRRFIHPESGPNRLDRKIGDYAWHGKHHVAHITSLRSREGW